MFSSDDEDDQTERVATQSIITYAIAMNNRMAQPGCSSSGINGGGGGNDSSGSDGTNVVTEPAAVEQTTERYPKRQRPCVNYQEQLDIPDDDHYICKYILFATVDLNHNDTSCKAR